MEVRTKLRWLKVEVTNLETVIEELRQAAYWLHNERLGNLADRFSIRKNKILQGIHEATQLMEEEIH